MHKHPRNQDLKDETPNYCTKDTSKTRLEEVRSDRAEETDKTVTDVPMSLRNVPDIDLVKYQYHM